MTARSGSPGRRCLAAVLVLATALMACSVPAGGAPAAGAPAPPIATVRASAEQAVTRATGALERHPVAVVTPRPTPAPASRAVSVDLFEPGDFVPQYTFEWCVAASIQMAHNLVRPDRRTERADQGQLWEMARQRSFNAYNGANPLGWAQVLNEVGLGPYEVVSIAGYEEALRTAATALATTGRPVGLVMWRGRHAWVMNGFESIGNPSSDDDATITGVRVLDPLYPHGSGTWGPSPEPNSLLSPAELATQFLLREPRRWSSTFPTGYLMVLPVSDEVARMPALRPT